MTVNSSYMKLVSLVVVFFVLVGCQIKDKTTYTPVDIATFHPENYVCYRASSPLDIDGVIDEKAWENAPWTNLFVDIEGNIKPLPQYATRAKMLWDDNYLYVAAFMEEPHVWAKITERDAVIYYDNDFEVFIDPDGDTHGYYEFEMNAFNTVWDLLLAKPYRSGGPAINHWDINGLKSAVKVEGTINDPSDVDEGWSVEIAFPLDVLHEYSGGITAKPGNQWRINFSRVQWQTEVVNGTYEKVINPETGKHYPENNWVWSPQSFVNMHRPETWAFLQFSDIIVGQDTESFNLNNDELIKWELHNVFHAQRQYLQAKDVYTNSIKLLEKVGLTDLKYVSKIETTSSLYEATATSEGSKFIWHINNEGRTWKSNK